MLNPNNTTYYFDQEKSNIKIAKWLGIMGIIMITLCVPVYILASMEWSNNDSVDYEVKVQAIQTACSYLKKSDPKDNVLSVFHGD